MADKKKVQTIKQAIERAKLNRRLMIIEMPEELDTTPHWLVWVVLISFVGLAATIIWQMMNAGHGLQAHLPFL